MRVAILVDTPNITRSVLNSRGRGFRPDLQKVLTDASKTGRVVHAKAHVNDGIPRFHVVGLQKMGLSVVRSHAFDCDDSLVAWAVRVCLQVDCFVLCSGDKHFRSLVRLLKMAGRKVIVCAVRESCNKALKDLSDEYIEMPTIGGAQTPIAA